MLEAYLDPSESLDMRLKSWSYSRITVFEQCKFRAKLQYLDKIPEPERPLPPGKTEHANDRGTRVHEAAELYVKGGVELIPELQKFQAEFEALRGLYKKGKVSLETEWAVDQNWEPTAWMSYDTWARIKPDAIVRFDKKSALVIDHKTGKRWGNEIKHAEQMQLYMLAAFLRYPDLEHVRVELWYVDLDEIHYVEYKRSQGLRFLQNFDRRGRAMTECEAEDMKPNPNKFSCRWCPYKPVELGGTGHCSVGV